MSDIDKNTIIHVIRTIKLESVDVISKGHINFNRKNNYKDPKSKVGDYVRISKYKNIFTKGYVPNWSEKVFVIKKVKNTVPWTYLTEDLNRKKIIGTLYKKELQKNTSKRI